MRQKVVSEDRRTWPAVTQVPLVIRIDQCSTTGPFLATPIRRWDLSESIASRGMRGTAWKQGQWDETNLHRFKPSQVLCTPRADMATDGYLQGPLAAPG